MKSQSYESKTVKQTKKTANKPQPTKQSTTRGKQKESQVNVMNLKNWWQMA